jgi:N-acetylgalactosamine-N,N'-diacetylbacillosaminyl-diphospho-undecaprenol 4-alpha-N-acetylgalactosaminyltransferase
MQKNVFKYLNIADVFLYASEVEGFPNVLIEARELGLPIITSDFKSGAKEVIIGEYTKDT